MTLPNTCSRSLALADTDLGCLTLANITAELFEGVFFLRLRLQTQIQTWRHVCSVSHAVAWYMFDVVDHTNMLIRQGNNCTPIAVMNVIHDSPDRD